MKQQTWSKAALLAAGGTIIGWVILCGLLAVLAERELLNMQTIRWLTLAGSAGILLLMSWLAACRAGKGRLPAAMSVVAVVLLCCILAKLTLFSSCAMAMDIRLILPLVSGIAAGLLASKRKIRRK